MNESFYILVPYNGKMVIATAEAVGDPIEFRYEVTYPDQVKKYYQTFEKEEDYGWTNEIDEDYEEFKTIGTIIDQYRFDNFLEPFFIEVDSKTYAIQPFTLDDGLTVQYRVYDETRPIMDVFYDENDWKAVDQGGGILLKKIGQEIEAVIPGKGQEHLPL